MNGIVRALFAAVVSLCVQTAYGADSPMEKFSDLFRTSCVSLKCRYEIALPQTVVKGEAEGLVQGSAYRMNAGGFDFFCDALVLWTLDNDAKEVVIELVEDTASGCAANPAQLFVRLSDAFEVVSHSSANGNWTYKLAATEDCGIKTAEIVMTSAGILIKGNFILADGNRMKVDVLSMASSAAKPSSYFRPDTDFSSWVVTDLR